MNYLKLLLLVVSLSFMASTTSAQVVLVEPGHALTPIADSFAPIDPSQSMLDSACIFFDSVRRPIPDTPRSGAGDL